MISHRWRKILTSLLLATLLLVTSCQAKDKSPYAKVQQESTQRGATPAVAKTATQGASFNKFFPKSESGDGYKVIPAQEKKGFAEYKLNKGSKTMAMLSINDTTSTPDAKKKYQTSTQKIGGYPAAESPGNGTGILVNNRYQVKVQSRDASFTKNDRMAWLQKFNLSGLAQLK